MKKITTSLDLNGLSLKQLQENFPEYPKSLSKKILIQNIQLKIENEKQIAALQAEIINKGYSSLEKILLSLRQNIGASTENYVVGESIPEIEKNLCLQTSYKATVFCALIQIFEGEKVITQTLTDKWSYLYLKNLQDWT